MLKYISQVYENHSNNLVKFIVHLLISSGGDVLFSLGDKKHKQLIFLRGLSVITLALGTVYSQKLHQPEILCQPRKRKQQDTQFGK